jgi:hypothetical protein
MTDSWDAGPDELGLAQEKHGKEHSTIATIPPTARSVCVLVTEIFTASVL